MYPRRIQHDNAYVSKPFYVTATTVAVGIDDRIPDTIHVKETIFSRKPEWHILLIKQEQARRSERKIYVDELTANGDSETALAKESGDDFVFECRIPTEPELQQARLMNIPTRGFCVSADIEKITAKSYRYIYDPEEFAPPDID